MSDELQRCTETERARSTGPTMLLLKEDHKRSECSRCGEKPGGVPHLMIELPTRNGICLGGLQWFVSLEVQAAATTRDTAPFPSTTATTDTTGCTGWPERPGAATRWRKRRLVQRPRSVGHSSDPPTGRTPSPRSPRCIRASTFRWPTTSQGLRRPLDGAAGRSQDERRPPRQYDQVTLLVLTAPGQYGDDQLGAHTFHDGQTDAPSLRSSCPPPSGDRPVGSRRHRVGRPQLRRPEIRREQRDRPANRAPCLALLSAGPGRQAGLSARLHELAPPRRRPMAQRGTRAAGRSRTVTARYAQSFLKP